MSEQDPDSEPRLTDVSQLQIPGMEGLWRDALLVGEEVVRRLLDVDDRAAADQLIPQEIAVSPRQLALRLDQRQARRER